MINVANVDQYSSLRIRTVNKRTLDNERPCVRRVAFSHTISCDPARLEGELGLSCNRANYISSIYIYLFHFHPLLHDRTSERKEIGRGGGERKRGATEREGEWLESRHGPCFRCFHEKSYKAAGKRSCYVLARLSTMSNYVVTLVDKALFSFPPFCLLLFS